MGPLHGIRIIEIEGIGPCPFGGMLLADLGAEVIRVGRPEPSFLQASFDVMSRGKKSIVLDLKSEAGKNALLKLVAGVCAILVVLLLTDRALLVPLACALLTVIALHALGFWLVRKRTVGVPVYQRTPPPPPLLEEEEAP